MSLGENPHGLFASAVCFPSTEPPPPSPLLCHTVSLFQCPGSGTPNASPSPCWTSVSLSRNSRAGKSRTSACPGGPPALRARTVLRLSRAGSSCPRGTTSSRSGLRKPEDAPGGAPHLCLHVRMVCAALTPQVRCHRVQSQPLRTLFGHLSSPRTCARTLVNKQTTKGLETGTGEGQLYGRPAGVTRQTPL